MDVELGVGQRLLLRPVVPATLGAAGRVDALVALQRLRSWVDAQEQTLLAAMVEPGDPPVIGEPDSAACGKQFVREEIACALRISPLTVNARLHVARELVHRLPAMLGLLESGVVSMRAARLLAETVGPLPDAVATAVQERVLARAPLQTFPNFRACVLRAVLAVDPRAAAQRHDTAVEQRRVESRVLADGMGSLYAVLAADDLQAVLTAVQATADALPAQLYPPGPYAADQRRADALVALTTSESATRESGPGQVGRRHGRRPSVQVTVALSTLLGLDDQPGDLAGHGPVPAVLARRIAADTTGTWRRLVTDPLGTLVDYGRRTYRPPQQLADHVLARDRHCRFPGCRRPAAACDLDHQTGWADGGTTDAHNLQCLCPRHHALKHETGWTVHGDPTGTLTWTSPTGHTYLDPPGEHPPDTTVPPSTAGRAEPDEREKPGESGGHEQAA